MHKTKMELKGKSNSSSIPRFICLTCGMEFNSPLFSYFKEKIRRTKGNMYNQLLRRVGLECDGLLPILMHESYSELKGDIYVDI